MIPNFNVEIVDGVDGKIHVHGDVQLDLAGARVLTALMAQKLSVGPRALIEQTGPSKPLDASIVSTPPITLTRDANIGDAGDPDAIAVGKRVAQEAAALAPYPETAEEPETPVQAQDGPKAGTFQSTEPGVWKPGDED
jgi:hypothetical protein